MTRNKSRTEKRRENGGREPSCEDEESWRRRERKKKDEGNQMKNVEIREGRTRKRLNTRVGRGGSNPGGVRAVAHTRGPEHH